MPSLSIEQKRLLNFVGNRGVMNHVEYLQRTEGQAMVNAGYVVVSKVDGIYGARLTAKGKEWFESVREAI